jgi:hypothetical protein
MGNVMTVTSVAPWPLQTRLELATNAVQASRRPKVRADLAIVPVVRLWLTSDGMSMVIHIWDASDDMPVRQDTTVDEEGRRGLLLVDALAKDWGTHRKSDGKVVWAVITLADP